MGSLPLAPAGKSVTSITKTNAWQGLPTPEPSTALSSVIGITVIYSHNPKRKG